MRHAAVFFAERVADRTGRGEQWDFLYCSDMLNLAEFLGLCPESVARLPTIVYFHENQLTYPVRHNSRRDLHFAYTNFTTTLAAQRVWFNSEFHRREFLNALPVFLKRMPDHQQPGLVKRIAEKSRVFPPGIDQPPQRTERMAGPLRILWAARWEHDKDPKFFFDALRALKSRGVAFRVNVIGEQFRDGPQVFKQARSEFADEIDRWGYQPTREAYLATLGESDVVVSTARHEFFGLSVVEAIAAGAYPLLPARLSYPELLDLAADPSRHCFFYHDDANALAMRLVELSRQVHAGGLFGAESASARHIVARFFWPNHVGRLDGAMRTCT